MALRLLVNVQQQSPSRPSFYVVISQRDNVSSLKDKIEATYAEIYSSVKDSSLLRVRWIENANHHALPLDVEVGTLLKDEETVFVVSNFDDVSGNDFAAEGVVQDFRRSCERVVNHLCSMAYDVRKHPEIIQSGGLEILYSQCLSCCHAHQPHCRTAAANALFRIYEQTSSTKTLLDDARITRFGEYLKISLHEYEDTDIKGTHSDGAITALKILGILMQHDAALNALQREGIVTAICNSLLLGTTTQSRKIHILHCLSGLTANVNCAREVLEHTNVLSAICEMVTKGGDKDIQQSGIRTLLRVATHMNLQQKTKSKELIINAALAGRREGTTSTIRDDAIAIITLLTANQPTPKPIPSSSFVDIKGGNDAWVQSMKAVLTSDNQACVELGMENLQGDIKDAKKRQEFMLHGGTDVIKYVAKTTSSSKVMAALAKIVFTIVKHGGVHERETMVGSMLPVVHSLCQLDSPDAQVDATATLALFCLNQANHDAVLQQDIPRTLLILANSTANSVVKQNTVKALSHLAMNEDTRNAMNENRSLRRLMTEATSMDLSALYTSIIK